MSYPGSAIRNLGGINRMVYRPEIHGTLQENFQPIGTAQIGRIPDIQPLGYQNQLGGSNLAQAVPAEQPQQSNLLNPFDWWRGRNQQTADEVKAGEYQGGKGGSIDSMLRRTSELNRLMNEL